jgi:hypothetical protein
VSLFPIPSVLMGRCMPQMTICIELMITVDSF